MLGTIGFSAAALVVVLYGLSSTKLQKKGTDSRMKVYGSAYLVAALAFLAWAVGTQGSDSTLQASVLVGDGLLMVSTLLLLWTLAPAKYATILTTIAAVVSVLAVIYRAQVSGPDPIMRDSILVFNTPRAFGAFLALVLLLVWLRANMHFYERVVEKVVHTNLLRPSYFAANVLGFMGVSGFLFARKTVTIITSFTMVALAFATMAALNYIALRGIQKGVRHAR